MPFAAAVVAAVISALGLRSRRGAAPSAVVDGALDAAAERADIPVSR
ncbi:hypothetical protein OG520_07365 [Streptomyces sp. NBC_00984]|nr:hypothetical protein OG520_07365 [Streptomyces sp. NBC_00984]